MPVPVNVLMCVNPGIYERTHVCVSVHACVHTLHTHFLTLEENKRRKKEVEEGAMGEQEQIPEGQISR